MSPEVEMGTHWDSVYRDRGTQEVSWFQPFPTVSLELIDALATPTTAGCIDVGGGASLLVDQLVGRGWSDLTVLDLSQVALDAARARVGPAAAVNWVCADVRYWHSPRRFQLWHDRAVFHFLVEEADRRAYLSSLRSALEPGGAAIVATFAQDGPQACSGLPVVRYGEADLAAALAGQGMQLLTSRHEEHTTPSGSVQPFSWVAARLPD
ncbi:MAG TPA: class I SAM-dependent methyltransferase [Candidatus Dormibacteraeota bacterium]|nr:class I SAM-dependent methyltransferase [Candidatus Dormibacteraeota bacterium]